jgi:F-type H+-transporting ATPase subunit gamma
LFKTTLEWLRTHKNSKVIAVGKKAVSFVRKLDVELFAQFTGLPDYARTNDILPIASLITTGFLNQDFRSVHLVYMDFVNTLSQKVRAVSLLPVAETFPSNVEATVAQSSHSEYIFEPSAEAILNDLLPYYIENSLYQTLLESKASEHSARMVAMKNASENANDLADELKLIFNKSRQAAITDELRDIATATLTLSV